MKTLVFLLVLMVALAGASNYHYGGYSRDYGYQNRGYQPSYQPRRGYDNSKRGYGHKNDGRTKEAVRNLLRVLTNEGVDALVDAIYHHHHGYGYH